MNAPTQFPAVCHTGRDVRDAAKRLIAQHINDEPSQLWIDQLLGQIIADLDKLVIDELTPREAFDEIADGARLIARAAEGIDDVPFWRLPKVIKEMGESAREIEALTEAECFKGGEA